MNDKPAEQNNSNQFMSVVELRTELNMFVESTLRSEFEKLLRDVRHTMRQELPNKENQDDRPQLMQQMPSMPLSAKRSRCSLARFVPQDWDPEPLIVRYDTDEPTKNTPMTPYEDLTTQRDSSKNTPTPPYESTKIVAKKSRSAAQDHPNQTTSFRSTAETSRDVSTKMYRIRYTSMQEPDDVADDLEYQPYPEKQPLKPPAMSFRSSNGVVYDGLNQRDLSLHSVDGDRCCHKGCFAEFVQSKTFDVVVGIIIIINAITLGIQAQYTARNPSETVSFIFKASDHAFSFIFTVEITLRALIYQHTFASYVSRNVLDTIVVVIQTVNEILLLISHIAGTEQCMKPYAPVVRVLTVFRIARLFRIVRMIDHPRFLRIFDQLRLLIASVVDSIRCFLWVVVLLLCIVYAFAVCLTHMVVYHRALYADVRAGTQDLEYFESVESTMLTLYEVVLDGVPWCEVIANLREFPFYVSATFLLYISIGKVALMNIVTAVFVTSALEHADVEKRTTREKLMLSFFKETDVNNDGTLSWDEFKEQLGHPTLIQFLNELDLREEQAEGLFHLIDVGGTGEIYIDDFVNGCLQLPGPAKSIDLLVFAKDMRDSGIAPTSPKK